MSDASAHAGFRTASPLTPQQIVAAYDRLPDAVVIIGEDSRVLRSNFAAQRLFHPEPLQRGAPIPDLGWNPPLEEILERLWRHRTVEEGELSAGDRTFALVGAVHRADRLAILQITDAGARSRQSRSDQSFAVDAAHELLGPLTAIAGAVHVLQGAAKEDSSVRDRFIAHIAEATDRLISTSTALLVLARAESGAEAPTLELVPLQPLLDDVVRRKADVVVDCPEKVGVLADGDLLRQALGTLVDNARRHSQGTVVIDVGEADGKVSIDVVDSGGGILPEHLEHVGDRFFSAGGPDAGGFGIGLSIASRAATVLGGSLDVTSTREGTRASLRLPSARLL